MDPLQKLREYGLSEKEALVYLTLLKLGTSTTTQIAVASNISRTTIYDIIKSLRDKGIISSSSQNKIMHIQAASPEKLIHLLDERQNAIKEILPVLKSMETKSPELPKTELFVGKEGIKTAYQALLDNKTPLFAFSNTNAMLKLMPYYAPRHIAERVKNKIPLKVLSEDSPIARKILFSKDAQEHRETRVLNSLKKAAITIYITKGLVATMSTSENEPLGILIHHEDFAKALQIVFDEIWSNAEKLNKTSLK